MSKEEDRLRELEADVHTLKVLYQQLWRIDLMIIATFHDVMPERHDAIVAKLREARVKFPLEVPMLRDRIDEVLAAIESKGPARH